MTPPGAKPREETGESDVLIDRLNHKLNSYIRRHQLEEEPEEWREAEPTYRLIQLKFEELKKHGEIGLPR